MRVCIGCGTKLEADAPQGLCPQCLLKAGLETIADTSGVVPLPPDPAELAKHFPQLEIVELLGQGGMGVVYKARQRGLDRLVALKILSSSLGKDASFAQRFALEARSLARLNHPNIVSVYDFGQAADFYYFIMEYVDGTNLRQMIHGKKLTPEEALAIVPRICEALQFAHEEGIVHRDIKPENILMDKKGRVKIADFGLAKLLGKARADYQLTAPQTVMGTPHYMAPEQLERPLEVDHRADIYSLGVVFYEMLTGELPLGRFALPSTKAQIDVRLDDVVLRSLENKPERRYQHASDLKTQLESICGMLDKLPPNLRTAFGYEYRSKATLFGLPLVHVAAGIDVATGKRRIAKGIIAIGDIAHGIVAFGGLAVGVIAFGGAAVGVIASGGFGLGIISLAGIAIALGLGVGGFAIAPIAMGGFAYGYYAGGGAAFGMHAAGGNARDPIAREFFRGWPMMQLMIWNLALGIFGVIVGVLVPLVIKRKILKKQRG